MNNDLIELEKKNNIIFINILKNINEVIKLIGKLDKRIEKLEEMDKNGKKRFNIF